VRIIYLVLKVEYFRGPRRAAFTQKNKEGDQAGTAKVANGHINVNSIKSRGSGVKKKEPEGGKADPRGTANSGPLSEGKGKKERLP